MSADKKNRKTTTRVWLLACLNVQKSKTS